MTRTLHNSLMALSIAGLLLVLGLVAASPVPTQSTPTLPSVSGSTATAIRNTDHGAPATADAGQALALGAAIVAVAATEAALSAAFPDAGARDRGTASAAPAARKGNRPRRSARTTIALPYFSFARGLRGGNGA